MNDRAQMVEAIIKALEANMVVSCSVQTIASSFDEAVQNILNEVPPFTNLSSERSRALLSSFKQVRDGAGEMIEGLKKISSEYHGIIKEMM